MSLRCRTARVILMAAKRKSPLPVRVSRGHGYSGLRLVALRQENQPHELQHRSHEVDDDSSKKRPKPIQHRSVIDLQRIVMIPMPKSGKKRIPFTPLNSVGVRLRAALKLKIASVNAIWQVRATPLQQRQMDSGGGFIVSRKIAMTE